ncbi:MAG: acyl-CoA thioesterase [Polaribacter sp.]|uniref:acyl-CoA thioesterase n=1 Tax=Polaribacter sp. TaxID=1920175 RepID=UPI003EF59B64
MITNLFQLRPRYGEVDKMGYVYHANYAVYCHQARNELLRKLGLDEVKLEENQIMLPVVSFDIKYKKPARFDELITIKTIIKEMPKVRFSFEFEITNEQKELLSKAKSDVVFVDILSRFPKRIPSFIGKKLATYF